VQAQIQLSEGSSFTDIGLDGPNISAPRGFAIQTRINMETLMEDGTVKPSGGTLRSYEVPNGPGVRTDGFGYAGYTTSPSYDSLLAKVIVHSPSPKFESAVRRSLRALSEFRIEGISANIPFLTNVLNHPDFINWSVHTRWVDENVATLAKVDSSAGPKRWVESAEALITNGSAQQASPLTGTAPVMVDTSDPLALFDYDRQVKGAQGSEEVAENNSANLIGLTDRWGWPLPSREPSSKSRSAKAMRYVSGRKF